MDEGKSVSCHWVDVPEPDPPIDDVRYQAQHAGAAVFVRGEGVTVLDDGVYFSSTEGGAERLGQLFRYVDSGPVGELELVYEVRDLSLLRPDNLTGAPWGDLVVCEDLDHGSNRLVGLRPDGSRYTIATNPVGEWAGACFGDDGTLFANVQRAGHSLAIVGLSADRAATIG